MLRVQAALLQPRAIPRAAPRLLAAPWPLAVFFLGYPLLWVLGLANFSGPILAVPMLASLAMCPRLRVPRGFGIWLLFLGWMLASGLMLDRSLGQYLTFAYRAATYGSATVFFVYAYNLPRQVTSARVADLLAAFWVVVALGGLAAVTLPVTEFPSLVELLLPSRLLREEFVSELVHPRLSQVQVFLGYPVARPAAPFVYTNNWGSSFALLLPIFLARWLHGPSPLRRTLARPLLALSAAPVVVSVNRGLWLSLGLVLAYVAVRAARAGRVRALRATVLAFGVVALIAFLSPLRAIVQDRLDTPHSNDSRLTLYDEALERVGESPLLGFGSPQATQQAGRRIPPVGTQGQFWMVLFSHGVVGAFLFVGWFVLAFVRVRRVRRQLPFWCGATLLVGLFQLPFYGMLPTQLHVVMVAAAVGLRPADAPGFGTEETWR